MNDRRRPVAPRSVPVDRSTGELDCSRVKHEPEVRGAWGCRDACWSKCFVESGLWYASCRIDFGMVVSTSTPKTIKTVKCSSSLAVGHVMTVTEHRPQPVKAKTKTAIANGSGESENDPGDAPTSSLTASCPNGRRAGGGITVRVPSVRTSGTPPNICFTDRCTANVTYITRPTSAQSHG